MLEFFLSLAVIFMLVTFFTYLLWGNWWEDKRVKGIREGKKAILLLDDARMRHGLMKILWQFREDAQDDHPLPFPPNMDDEQIKEELRRILS